MAAAAAARSGARIGKLARREERLFYPFAAPWLIGFVLWTLGPMLGSLGLSFTDYNGVQTPSPNGLRNYLSLFTDPLF